MKLAAFYLDEEPNSEGTTLAEMMAYDDFMMERKHNYIQWMFPSSEPSAFHRSPEVTEFDIKSIRCRGQPALKASLDKFQGFLMRNPYWCTIGNHNLMRITRVIRSLDYLVWKEKHDSFMIGL